MDEVFSFISSHYPVIGLMIIVAVIVYFATMYHVSVQNTRKKVENLPCDKHYRAIVNIEKALIGKKKFKSEFSITQSPRKLSEKGHGLYVDSAVNLVLKDNIDWFISQIDEISPQSALDAEDAAYHVLLNSTSEAMFKPVKDWLYNHPVYLELDIDMSAICYVASFELRDAYLKAHPELIPADEQTSEV
jgi:hypothetical protein